MRFDFNFYSSLLLIFFVHGFVYAVLLYRKATKNETTSDKWLAIFLLLCIFYTASWMLGFAGWYDHQPLRDVMFYTPLQQLFFIGPSIFMYIQSLLNPTFTFGKKQWLHFIPGFLYIIFCIVVVVTDKLILKKYYFLADQVDPEFDAWYQILGFISMVCYFIISLRYYSLYKKLMLQLVSYAEVVSFKWVRNFLMSFLLMLFLRLLFYIGSFIPFFQKMQYVGPWWEYFSFAIVFYYVAIAGYANAIETKVPFRLNVLSYKPTLFLNNLNENKENSFIEDAEIVSIENYTAVPNGNDELLQQWMPLIKNALIDDHLFEDAELTLTQLAKHLKTHPSIISKVINQGFLLNFNDFINNFRIEAVKEKLVAGEQKTQTLLGIAFDCGFNSKATFNRAFKKNTGSNPKEWILGLSK